MLSLPIISARDLTSANAEIRASAIRKLGAACREVGFFYLSDHAVSHTELTQVFAAARDFFALPFSEKKQLSIKQSPHNRGYIAMADERLNPKSGVDLKEAFNLGVDLAHDHPDVLAGKLFRGVNFWPDIEGWKAQMLEYFKQCLDIGRLLHRAFSVDLGKAEDFFAAYLTDPIATLRILHYPQATDKTTRIDNGAGAHTDYGNITLLATDGVPGLEVCTRQGHWIDAPSVEGALICNIGDCLMRWSNDDYLSTPHRVRSPERERYSIAFFLEANPDAVVDPRDIFPMQAPKYPPITCADYLAERLNATYGYRVKAEVGN